MNTTPAAASGTLARTRRTVTAVSVSAHITIRQASPAPTGAQKACRVDGGRRDLRAAARAGKQQRAARQRRPETQQVQPAAKHRLGVVDTAAGIVKQARPGGACVRHRLRHHVLDLRRVPPGAVSARGHSVVYA